MIHTRRRSRFICAALCASLFIGIHAPIATAGSIVQINTIFGAIQVKLNDEATPNTVKNFLNYVNSGRYTNTIIHRSVPGFVIQGGGFTSQYAAVATDAPVANEFFLPNVAGTISMAKLGGDTNSATSQWFLSLADNRENLDNQNNGFTVFGHILGNGLSIANQIAGLPTGDFGDPAFGIPPATSGAMTQLPVQNYTQADYNQAVTPTTNNLAIISSVSVIGTWTPVGHNYANPYDVDKDGLLHPVDLLLLIDESHRAGGGFRELDASTFVGPLQLDVDNNGAFDQQDLDREILGFNQGSSGSSLLAMTSTSLDFNATPEPSSAVLAALGVAALMARHRRRRSRV